jgi:hypothetical protein
VTGVPLWPAPPAGGDPEDYARNDRTPAGTPARPTNWAVDGNDVKLASERTTTSAVATNPQELCGVKGNSVDTAWQVTTGRPTTVIAILDSGIDWCQAGLIDKIALNRGALPPPEIAAGRTKAQLEAAGGHFTDTDPYDLDDAGLLDVSQYAQDPRVAAVVADYGGTFCASHGGAGYSGLSAEDLIRTFADPRLPDGRANPYAEKSDSPAGFSGAIAGWNFVDNNDDPYDDVHYDHGTGEAQDMAGSADSVSNEVGACPDCMVMPVRVGTSFIATGDAFAEGVLFAVDSGATVVSEALGAIDQTATGNEAIAYATAHGVPIVGSAADEESEHANLPAAAGGIIDVNSTTSEPTWKPGSYLYLNGCTNYGPEIDLTVESDSCSSEATGKTAGTVGLIESEAANAVAAGTLKPYPGLRSATGRPVPLSANEVKQILTMSGDDVDFATAAPTATPPAPADNYAVTSSNVPLATTRMYPTTPGYDIYTGWGRLDAARAVTWVKEGRIPPVADITAPPPLTTEAPYGTLPVIGTVAAVRSRSYHYQVEVGIGPSPAAGAWHTVAHGSGHGSFSGLLTEIPMASVGRLFTEAGDSLTGGAVSADGQADDDRFTFTIRIVVTDADGNVGVSQEAEFAHDDPTLAPGFPRTFRSSLVASPRLAPIGPGGEDALIVPESGGTIDALLPDGRELPGWPVHTEPGFVHRGEAAYRSGAVPTPPRGELIGGVAVGDLGNASGHDLDVVATDALGNIYAWDSSGRLLPGWPRHSNPDFSEPSARNATNRLLPGFVSAPALADLQGNGRLDVVAASMDRHLYAFEAGGEAVPGWPVLVVDPSEVQSVDPVTNQVTFLPSAHPDMGSELVDTPAIGNLDGGSGPPDVVVGADEEYAGTANANLGTLGAVVGSELNPANSRVYAIYPDGSLHPAAAGAPAPAGMPDPGAFLPGWPARIADLDANLLPTIGDGVTATPAVADLDGKGPLEVVTSSSAGPMYELDPDGSSYLGTTGGLPNVAAFVPAGKSILGDLLTASLPALGDPSVGVLGKAGSPLSIAAPAASVGRLLDEVAPGEQTPHNNQVVSWSADGALDDGSPDLMNDLQFATGPLIADVGGNGQGDLVEPSGLYDLRAYQANGKEVPGFPKFTGGWTLDGALVGPWGTDAHQIVAAGNRAGELFVWTTKTPACAGSGSWPQQHHDLWNTSDLSEHGATQPACAR